MPGCGEAMRAGACTLEVEAACGVSLQPYVRVFWRYAVCGMRYRWGTVNLRSCRRSANHISLIRHTRPGESRRRTGENRPRIAQLDSAICWTRRTRYQTRSGVDPWRSQPSSGPPTAQIVPPDDPTHPLRFSMEKESRLHLWRGPEPAGTFARGRQPLPPFAIATAMRS